MFEKEICQYFLLVLFINLCFQPFTACIKWTFFSFFQVDALRWRALAQQAKDESQCIHFKVLFEALKGLEKQWDKDLLSCEEVGNILTSCSY